MREKNAGPDKRSFKMFIKLIYGSCGNKQLPVIANQNLKGENNEEVENGEKVICLCGDKGSHNEKV